MELTGIVPFEIKGVKKEVRAIAAQPHHEAGNFYLPNRARWTDEFIDEHAAFPNGAHDDWVDTTSMANLRLLVDFVDLGTRAPASVARF
jgi:predicted phage terminase large subunit-like protein